MEWNGMEWNGVATTRTASASHLHVCLPLLCNRKVLPVRHVRPDDVRLRGPAPLLAAALPVVGRRARQANALLARPQVMFECDGTESSVQWNGMEWNGMEWNGMEWSGVPHAFLARPQRRGRVLPRPHERLERAHLRPQAVVPLPALRLLRPPGRPRRAPMSPHRDTHRDTRDDSPPFRLRRLSPSTWRWASGCATSTRTCPRGRSSACRRPARSSSCRRSFFFFFFFFV